MAFIIGRGRYARATYPEAVRAAPPPPAEPRIITTDSGLDADTILSAGDVFVTKHTGGPPIECTFSGWTPGDVLETSFTVSCEPFRGISGDLLAVFWVAVSLDGGTTWTELKPTSSSAIKNNGLTANDVDYAAAGGTSIVLAVKPIIRIGCLNVTNNTLITFDTGGGNSANLRCRRIPVALYDGTPPGVL